MSATILKHPSSGVVLRGEHPLNQQPGELYTAIRETVHGDRGRAKVIAAELGCPASHVTDLADPLRRVPLKAYEVPGLVRATGCFAVLDHLEGAVGRTAVALPRTPAPAVDLPRVVALCGEFLMTCHKPQTARRIINRLIAALCEYRASLDAAMMAVCERQK
jgi:hypothetical protein